MNFKHLTLIATLLPGCETKCKIAYSFCSYTKDGAGRDYWCNEIENSCKETTYDVDPIGSKNNPRVFNIYKREKNGKRVIRLYGENEKTGAFECYRNVWGKDGILSNRINEECNEYQKLVKIKDSVKFSLSPNQQNLVIEYSY